MTTEQPITKAYKVLTIDEMYREAEIGIEKFHRVRIKTKGGLRLTIDVGEKDFTAEKAAPILLKRAAEADRILAL